MQKELREEFEKAITKLGLPLSFHIDLRTGEYLFNGTQWAWEAWRAARSRPMLAEEKLREALQAIVDWKIPPAKGSDGQLHAYHYLYGSNGERDYMRQIAEQALADAEAGDARRIELLRLIRDKAWQMGRVDAAFGQIERIAEELLASFGVVDGSANPRPHGWWSKEAPTENPRLICKRCGRIDCHLGVVKGVSTCGEPEMEARATIRD